jgi:hypothetical protein
MEHKSAAGSALNTSDAVPAAGSAEAYARWLEHMQRSLGRHAAITRNLNTWSSYKSWAESVKDSFEPGSK